MNNQFDLFKALQAKEEGIDRATHGREESLQIGKDIARKIALQGDGTCHADLVQKELIEMGIDLGPAAGALFKGKEWEFTGKWVTGQRVHNHGHVLRIWRLK